MVNNVVAEQLISYIKTYTCDFFIISYLLAIDVKTLRTYNTERMSRFVYCIFHVIKLRESKRFQYYLFFSFTIVKNIVYIKLSTKQMKKFMSNITLSFSLDFQ